MNKIRKNKIIASFLILFQCFIFGLSFTIIKMLLVKNFPPLLMLALRFAIGCLFLFLFGCIFRKIRNDKFSKSLCRISKREFFYGSLLGFLLFCAFGLQALGLLATTPARSGLFTNLYVIFVPLLTMIIQKKFHFKSLISALISFIGIFFVLNVFHENYSFNYGDSLTIACGFIFALHFLFIEYIFIPKNDAKPINAFNCCCIQLGIVSIVSLILSLFFESQIYKEIQLDVTFFWIIFLGIISTSVTYLIQFFAQKVISAEQTTVLSCSEGVFTLLFSIFFGYDTFSWTLLIGTIILILGMLLSIKKERRIK